MKRKYILLSLILFFLNSSFIFGQALSLKVAPEKPKPGDVITISYNPTGTLLEKADKISVLIYAYGKMGKRYPIYYTNELELKKKDNVWIGKFSVADTCAGVVLSFTDGENYDNNGSKLYSIQFVGKNGKLVKDACAGLASIYLHYTLFGNPPDPNTIIKLFEREFSLYPEQKKNYLIDYYFMFLQVDKEKAEKFIKEETLHYESTRTQSYDDLIFLEALYRGQGQTDKTKKVYATILERYPKSSLSEALKYNEAVATKDSVKKAELVNKFVEEFSNSSMLKLLFPDPLEQLVRTLTKEGRYEEAYEAIKKNPKASSMDYNSLAWSMYEKNVNLLLAKEIVLKGIALVDAEIKSSSVPAYYTKNQFRKYYDKYIIDTYGAILLKSGENTEALKYMTLAYKKYEGSDSDVTERYVQALLLNGKSIEAKKVLEKEVKKGRDTAKMKEILQNLK